jgi:hypothetical protein
MIELAIVPAGAVGPLEAQQGDVPLLGKGRDCLAEAVTDAFEQGRDGTWLPRCWVRNVTTWPPTCRLGT